MLRRFGVTEALHALLPAWTVDLFAALTVLGDLALVVPLLGLLYVVDVASALRRSGTHDPDGPLCSDRTAFLIATVFGGLALIVSLKTTFGVGRPPADLRAISPSEFGFPSGHTMAATVFWGALALWSTIGRRWQRFAMAGAIVSIVALSRLALGVHYLGDVLASVLLGGAYLAVVGLVLRDEPGRVFVVAIVIAALSVFVAGWESRPVLALWGTIGAAGGWRLLEVPFLRNRFTLVFRR